MPRLDGNRIIYDLDEMAKYDGRNFDQRTVMKEFATAASDFGMCKALSVCWIKRHFNAEGFWEEWITSPEDETRGQAQLSIAQLSKDEVIDMGSWVQYQSLLTDDDSRSRFDALLEAKKGWHARYLSSHGIVLTEVVPARPLDSAEIGRQLMRLRGYLLFYLLNDNGTGHCMALYSAGPPPNRSYFFDPNFGELEQGFGFRALYELVPHVVADYTVMFRLANVGTPTQYRIEQASPAI